MTLFLTAPPGRGETMSMNQEKSRREEVRQEQSRQEEEARRNEQQMRERHSLETMVCEHVMQDLGEPAGLHHVQVRQLWNCYYRVNLFVGPDAVSCKIAHSYFLEADGDGKILSSSP